MPEPQKSKKTKKQKNKKQTDSPKYTLQAGRA
jgi:hypothetical protein